MTKADDTNGTIWRRLLVDDKKNVKIWYDMKNTYKTDMEKYFKMLEDDENRAERRQAKLNDLKKHDKDHK